MARVTQIEVIELENGSVDVQIRSSAAFQGSLRYDRIVIPDPALVKQLEAAESLAGELSVENDRLREKANEARRRRRR